MQVILLYLLVIFCGTLSRDVNGLRYNFLFPFYNATYYNKQQLQQYDKNVDPPSNMSIPAGYTSQMKKEEYVYKNTTETLYYIGIQPKEVQTSTPTVPIKDAETNPNNLTYRHRPVCKRCRSIVAGLDNMRPIDETYCRHDKLVTNCTLSSPVQCARTCRKGDYRICYYKFVVENYQIYGPACNLCTPCVTNTFCSKCQCVPADGIERSAQLVNRQMPGPSIEVCEGDHVVIDVTNHMPGYGVSIHWHGILQRGSQYYDGVPFVTQCPIGTGDTFRYQWDANDPGTHFWHAHSGLQKMDGVFGSIVVRKPPEKDPHLCHLYDCDLSEHVVVINDWMHEPAVHCFPGRRFSKVGQVPDTILINGKGQYTDQNTGATTNTTLAIFYVKLGKRYRFRLINAFCTACPGMFTIQDHKMIVISTDGQDIKPITVDSITSFSGERYDFILYANQPVGCYWIQVRGMGKCDSESIQQLAMLCYKDAPHKPLLQPPTYNEGLPRGTVLNALNACGVSTDDVICVSKLNSLGKMDKGILQREADMKFCLPVGFHPYTVQEVYQSNQYFPFMDPLGSTIHVSATIDNKSFVFPRSPPLSQPMDIPDDQYCNKTTLPAGCTKRMCSCTHMLAIGCNKTVDVILYDIVNITNLTHPFHLHGHAFYVIGMGRFHENVSSINCEIVQEMDKRNKINKCFDQPVRKDTVVMPYNGYVVLRFRANNPGYWLFHCHVIYHHMVGMDVLIKVGEQEDIPPVPENFPKCGNYLPPIECNACPPFDKNKCYEP